MYLYKDLFICFYRRVVYTVIGNSQDFFSNMSSKLSAVVEGLKLSVDTGN